MISRLVELHNETYSCGQWGSSHCPSPHTEAAGPGLGEGEELEDNKDAILLTEQTLAEGLQLPGTTSC